ncbi:MAG: hypothetical protein Q8S84_02740 [bacterium]|nr:hypothetical protein [bacterium]MDP3380454.1 hypothetical protein [bacterium]
MIFNLAASSISPVLLISLVKVPNISVLKSFNTKQLTHNSFSKRGLITTSF